MRFATNAFRGALLTTLLCATAAAERAPDDRDQADYVVTGKVTKVFERHQGRTTQYIVQILIDEVHRGADLKPGQLFYTNCFRTRRALIPQPEPSGHDAVPAEGQTIKAYVYDRQGAHEGNYPDWFDEAERPAKAGPTETVLVEPVSFCRGLPMIHQSRGAAGSAGSSEEQFLGDPRWRPGQLKALGTRRRLPLQKIRPQPSCGRSYGPR